MEPIGLFYGSRSGETMEVAELVQEALQEYTKDVHLYDIADPGFSIQTMDGYKNLILGSSTYRSGDLEPNWEGLYKELKAYDFSGKTVALFGLGNQFEYADTFASAMGILAREVLSGNGKLIGKWPVEDYMFDDSYSLADDDHFYGLALDQDYDPELTEQRIQEWVELIIPQFQ